MMSQASVEEDGVSWIDDTGGPSCTENVSTMDSANLTPAEVQFNLLNSAGADNGPCNQSYCEAGI